MPHDGTRFGVSVSIRQDRLPAPGPVRRRWGWDDVLESPPPEGGPDGAATYVVRHGFDDRHPDPWGRVGYATLVHAGEGGIRVEERLNVEPRALAQVMAAQRLVERRVESTSEAGVYLVRQGSNVLARRVPPRPAAAIERSTSVLVEVWRWIVRTIAAAARALAEAPDRLWASASAADAHLKRRHERRAIVRGLVRPYALSREGKTVALFLVGAVLALGLLAAHLAVTLLRPEWAAAWRALFGLFLLGLGSTVLFPFFPELRLPAVAAEAGPVPAVAALVLSMTLGAWMVLFLGDEIHAVLRRRARGLPILERALDRAEALAARYGFWVALLVLAVPMGPDTPVFYVLATTRTPVASYLSGVLLGSTVRFSAWFLLAGSASIY